ncbi:TonB-dependent receptor [Sphingomonas sp. CBMAI 2297]|uniref:TonB-dependent receptor n=1 Tax=Sphingomonas sp. CBMAI 2297 TaxID=2991720 RepID=UPI00245763E1|nr:TonB-dependent receptor [Sphingomonas sp. CBMAI 2297]MDH4745196.1 TonB-dependent receptor [Sphingomonas sp. CBMAI 2297]
MRLRLLSCVAVPALSFALAAPAFAQDTQTPADAAAQNQSGQNQNGQNQAEQNTGTRDPNEIVVTAQGRAQVLADVPLAVSAVTATQLERTGANDIRALNQVAPSLLVSSTGSDANTSARIRGVGTVGDNPGLESSVATFIDGVYRSRTGLGLNDLGEIERIEVLRGPQGTLGGRNASAGMLSVTTKGPEFTFGGMAEATYGNYDAWRLQGAVTGPLTEQLAFRLDGLYSKRDGFYHDVNTGRDINNRDRYLVRGQLLFQPSSDLSVRLIGDYSYRKEDCCAAVYATADVSQANAYVSPTNPGLIAPGTPVATVLTGITGTTFAQYFPGYNDAYSRRIATSANRSYTGKTKDWGFSAEVNWNLGGVELTSITAYRDYDNTQAADADYGLADILYFGPKSGRQFKTFTQELRFHGEALGGKLDWLVGGYYAHEDLDTKSELKFGNDYGRFAACRVVYGSFSAFYNPNNVGCLSPTGVAVLSNTLGPLGAAGSAMVQGLQRLDTVRNVGDDTANFDQTSSNFAFFTHNIFHVTSKVDLTVGLRYTNETKKLNANFNNTNTICPVQQANLLPYMGVAALAPLAGGIITLSCQGGSSSALNGLTLNDQRKENKFTGTAILSWKPVDNILLYGSYSRGYKAGGFNLDRSAFKNPNPAQPLPIFPISLANAGYYADVLQFEEETVTAYEAGMKLSTRGFNLNVAGFRQEFSNFQLNTFNGTVYLVQNINGCKISLNGGDRDLSATTGACPSNQIKPGVVSTGFEVEMAMSPVRDLNFNFGVTYAKTKYANNLVGSSSGAPLDPALRLLPGQLLSNAPEWVVTSSAGWTPSLGGSLRGLLYVDARLADRYNTGSDLFPQKEQQSFVVVNGRIGISGNDQLWALELWVQNATKANYMQVGFSSPFQAVSTTPTTGYPGGSQIFSAYLAEPRTYGITLRSRF